MIKFRILYGIRQILLLNPVSRKIMGVFIADPSSKFCASMIMCILKIWWNGKISGSFHLLHCLKYSLTAGIALGSRRHIGTGLGENDLCFRHTHAFNSQKSIGSNHQCLRVSITHILGSADNDTSRNEFNVFAGLQHPGKVIYRGVRIRATHGLDKGRNGVIMVVAVLIISDSPFLYAFRRNRKSDMDTSVRLPVSGEDSKLDGIKSSSRIPVCDICEKLSGIIVDVGMERPDALYGIGKCPVYKGRNIVTGQGFKLKYPRAGYKCAVYLKIRIFRCGAYESDCAVLNIGKEKILLGFVETMYLVYKQYGFPAVSSLILLSLRHHFLQVLFTGYSCIDRLKISTCGMSDDLCQCCLSGSRRSVKYNGTKLICLYGTIKQLSRADDMFLPHHLIKSPGSHT